MPFFQNIDAAMIASTAAGAWHLRAGDPTILDWLITLGYIATALLCLNRARSFLRGAMHLRRELPDSSRWRESVTPWYLLSSGTFMLGLNKELDLQTLFVQLARTAALSEGWYDLRRTAQTWFVLLLAAATIGVGGWLLRRNVYFVRQQLALSAGFAMVISYALLRALEFNHFSWVSRFHGGNHGPFWFLEFCGVGLMLFGLLRFEGATQPNRMGPHVS